MYPGVSQGDQPIPEARLARLTELIEPWFIFALVWSIGATCDNDGRTKFSTWLRAKMKEANVSCYKKKGGLYLGLFF